LGSDLRMRLPYVGDFQSMSGNFISVRLDRTTTKQPWEVNCKVRSIHSRLC